MRARGRVEETYVSCGDQRGIYARPFNTEQAAEYLGISTRHLMRLVHAGLVPASKVGNCWRFSQRRLAELVGVAE